MVIGVAGQGQGRSEGVLRNNLKGSVWEYPKVP